MLLSPEKLYFLSTLFPLLAYAETHYRFPGIPSLYFKREPEIIFDLPKRIEPNEDLPILLLVKDADSYPVIIKSIRASIKSGRQKINIALNEVDISIGTYLYYQFFTIEKNKLPRGEFEVDIGVDYSVSGKLRRARNDNHRRLTHRPFYVYKAPNSWPKDNGWYAGDLHIHSDATDDFVEFGAPIDVYKRFVRTIGISWLAITDHSYDLDDEPGKYYAPDPELKRWETLKKQIDRASDHECIIINGEEVSCGNSNNRNVHLLALNIDKFIPGYGDSGESWFHNSPTSSIKEVAENTLRQGGLPIAAHPGEKPLYLEKLLLNRGPWGSEDLRDGSIQHLQIFNGRRTDSFLRGIELWRGLLLDGYKRYIVAGSDAHGNFNRLRQIKTPFVSFRESDKQTFGLSRTLIYLGDVYPSERSILQAIKRGNCIITDGPFIGLSMRNNDGLTFIPGDSVDNFTHNEWEVNISIKSSEEFGYFRELIIFLGNILKKEESEVIHKTDFDSDYEYFFEEINFQDAVKDKGEFYIRGMLTTTKGNICLTNPIWFKG